MDLAKCVNEIWGKSGYKKYSQMPPITIGKVDPDILENDINNVRETLVKEKNSSEFNEILTDNAIKIYKQILKHHNTITNSEDWDVYFSYQKTDVEPNKTQRLPGIHFDGMQGKRYKTKRKTTHQYIVVNKIPTHFWLGSFDIEHLTYDDNWYNYFDSIIRNNEENYIKHTPEPYDIVFMTAYSLHESPIIREFTRNRCFLRFEFAENRYLY